MIGASFRRVPRALVSLAAAVLLTVLVFPEVFFGGGSLSAVPFDRVLGQPRPPATVEAYPNIDSRSPTSGLVDLGARTWQYEPTMRYMARVLRDGSNPSWNPYQASGSLGPETLDGMQLSPFVLLVAVLGGSATAFTIALLALVVLALYCLQQLFVRSLEMHRVAAVGAGFVFLLNGWVTATFTDVTCVPYLMFPIVLYAVVEFQRRMGPVRLLLAVAAYASLFATTFSPGQALDVILVTVVALVIDAWRRRGDERPGGPAGSGRGSGRAPGPGAGRRPGRRRRDPAARPSTPSATPAPTSPPTASSSCSPGRLGRWLVLPSYLVGQARPGRFFDGWQVYLGITPIVVVAAALARARDLARWLLVTLVGAGPVRPGRAHGTARPEADRRSPRPAGHHQRLLGRAGRGRGSPSRFGVAVDVIRRHGLSLAVVIAAVAVARPGGRWGWPGRRGGAGRRSWRSW